MVAIPAYLRAKILLMPVIPEIMVIAFLLSFFPTVEGLIHHQNSHPVAEIEEFRSGGIVTGAQSIESHLLEHLQLTLRSAGIESSTKGTQVVMIADSLELHPFAIEQETIVRSELDRADAEGCLIAVQDIAVLTHRSNCCIELRRLHAPEFGTGHGCSSIGNSIATCRHRHRPPINGADGQPSSLQFRLHRHGGILGGMIF